MQGSARKDVVFGAARVYTATVPGPKWKSWLRAPSTSTAPITARSMASRWTPGDLSGLVSRPDRSVAFRPLWAADCVSIGEHSKDAR